VNLRYAYFNLLCLHYFPYFPTFHNCDKSLLAQFKSFLNLYYNVSSVITFKHFLNLCSTVIHIILQQSSLDIFDFQEGVFHGWYKIRHKNSFFNFLEKEVDFDKLRKSLPDNESPQMFLNLLCSWIQDILTIDVITDSILMIKLWNLSLPQLIIILYKW